jgi:hypothetical protein
LSGAAIILTGHWTTTDDMIADLIAGRFGVIDVELSALSTFPLLEPQPLAPVRFQSDSAMIDKAERPPLPAALARSLLVVPDVCRRRPAPAKLKEAIGIYRPEPVPGLLIC